MKRRDILNIVNDSLDSDMVETLESKYEGLVAYTKIYFKNFKVYGYIAGFSMNVCRMGLNKYLRVVGESAILEIDIAGDIEGMPVMLYGGGLGTVVEYAMKRNKNINKFILDLSFSDLSNLLSMDSIVGYDRIYTIDRKWELVIKMPIGARSVKPVSCRFAFEGMPVVNGDEVLKAIDFSETEDVEAMFRGTAIESINLDSIGRNIIKNTCDMFGYCRELKAVNIKNQRFNHVNNIAYMFNGCTGLSSMDVGTFLNSFRRLEEYKGVFNGTNNLQWWRKNKEGLIITSNSSLDATGYESGYSSESYNIDDENQVCNIMDMRGIKYTKRSTGEIVNLDIGHMLSINDDKINMPANVLILNREQMVFNDGAGVQGVEGIDGQIATVIEVDSIDEIDLILNKANLFREKVICILR